MKNLVKSAQYKTRSLSLVSQASPCSLLDTPADALKEDWHPAPWTDQREFHRCPNSLKLSGEEELRSVWTMTFLLQHVEDSFPLTKGACLSPADNHNQLHGSGWEVRSQAAEVRRVRSMVTRARLLEEFPPVWRKERLRDFNAYYVSDCGTKYSAVWLISWRAHVPNQAFYRGSSTERLFKRHN